MVRKKKGKKKLDTLGKVMHDVRLGKHLTRTERKILSGAIDGAKKSRSELREERRRRHNRKGKGCC